MRNVTALVVALAATGAFADVTLPRVWSSRAVVQQRADVTVWGWADPGEAVHVTTPWAAEPASATAGPDGRWSLAIRTPEADGTPFSLTVQGKNTIILRDLLLGEVWLASGQSNMEWPLSASDGAPASVEAANHPGIRLFNAENKIAPRPQRDVVSTDAWRLCTPESARSFSAVAYHFAVTLQGRLNVPIGVIEADWGGTPAEAWTPLPIAASFPELARQAEFVASLDPDPNVRAAKAAKLASGWWDALDSARGAPGPLWAAPGFDDSAWGAITVPSRFAGDLASFDGVVYVRTRVIVPAESAGKPATLALGPIDDRDDAYVNGVRVGGTRDDGQWNKPRAYAVPANVLRAGENVIAVRVVDTGGPGGIFGESSVLKLEGAGVSVPLAGTWKYLKGPAVSDLPPIGQTFTFGPGSPASLYNAMIHPLAPFRLAGAIWYQGESNRGNADLYARLFPAMIRAWRDAWGQGDFPFYFVQIAPFNYGGDRGQTALLREAQAAALTLPNTGMAVTMDVGNPRDIHPTNKHAVGDRLARLALTHAYSQADHIARGPSFASMRAADGSATVTFGLHGAKSLTSRGGPPKHFLVAGHDGVFRRAHAEIIRPDAVRVHHPAVSDILAVRYAFEAACETNLFGDDDLPAEPFRTDAWPTPGGGWPPPEDFGRTEFLNDDPAFVALFNGRDLGGWVNMNTAPSTWRAEGGMIRCTGRPTGLLRTARPYENFVLELEWRHLEPQGNAGLFVWSDALTAKGVPFSRAVEVQVMVGSEADWYTSDGDVFPIHGARMTPLNPRPKGGMRSYPTEKRMKPAPEWNHYRVECLDGAISLAVNGKVVTRGTDASPRQGYICLESEGTPIDFRNIRIKELPASTPTVPAEMTARTDEGFVPLFSGLDFDGWKFEEAHRGHFTANDNVIAFDGQGPDLWSTRSFKNFVLIADWRWTAKPTPTPRPVILPDGTDKKNPDGTTAMVEIPDAGDSGIYLRGSSKSQVNAWCWPIGSGEVYGYRTDPAQPPEVRAGVTPKAVADAPIGQWNRFEITMKGERLTVVLNGTTVIENAHLPGVAAEGPLALQAHGSPIEWTNLFIKELP
ncbi:MAG: hypothetical protein HBSAPP03_04580 [Phycisphaerae bacterium]|nr:MAG: hypothetical protein HBSAPP03_04580 [Phycisphaerae bacterium]